jgi:ribosomal protein S18 acetylase RimI-like enzyme
MTATLRQKSDAAAPLTEQERGSALDFLARRPVHTVIMAGWLRNHGVVHPQHRGTFYRTKAEDGSISGVALIGRHTCFEASSDTAIRAFAEVARTTPDIKMVFGEAARMADFWRHYGPRPSGLTRADDVLLLENHDVYGDEEAAFDIRPAGRRELDQIVRAHAAMVYQETGIDPTAADADGFRSRCARRVEAGDVWVMLRDGELVFKTDIVSRTSQAVYIEGLWIAPRQRGRKIGKACMRGFCRRVLNGSNAVCGFVGVDNGPARALYAGAGFKIMERYEKYYV